MAGYSNTESNAEKLFKGGRATGLFSPQTFWLAVLGKAQVLLITAMTVWHRASVHDTGDPESEAAKWNSAIIDLII